ncbi:flap endonuclease-1 [Candidatus Woesearchaeota archaeon]|nr:flap endonuclease-1 [Candidatus Woesearchaeota archaeon]
MGVNLKELVIKKEINIVDLSGKTIVIDAYNALYQFLTTIRGPDGSLFTDSKGNTTSHLIGLLSRTTNFLKQNIRPVFVYDGVTPELKKAELQRRKEIKQEAKVLFEQAKKEGDAVLMKKFAARTSRLTEQMIDDSKKLLAALGIPFVQAPAEGEAQAAHMAKNGSGYAAVSQDYDSLLHGAPRLIINLNIAGRRKKGLSSTVVQPEIISLKDTLDSLGITQEQLICLAMLVGTDYSEGVKGIGPKKALALVKKYPGSEMLFEAACWHKDNSVGWKIVYETIKNMAVTDDYSIVHGKINLTQLIDFLVGEREFSQARVDAAIQPLLQKQQKSLGDW